MELMEYLRALKKRLWLILLITFLSTCSSALCSIYLIKPVYEAKITSIVGRVPVNNNERLEYTDVLLYERLIKTYSELVKSRVVLSEALFRLNYDMELSKMQSNLIVSPKGDTQILEIAVRDTDAIRATNIANTIAQVFIEKVKTLMHSEDVEIMDWAIVPEKPVKPRVALNTAAAFLLGLMVSLGLILLIEYMDNTLKADEDVEKYLSILVLADIPYARGKDMN